MPDYEDMILEKQELLDECGEDCRHCPYGVLVHSAFGAEWFCQLAPCFING